MASGRLGKCDLQSCCGAQIYQNLDANECPVSLSYHAQVLSTTANDKLTTYVGIASTTVFKTTDTWSWTHSNSMKCSFGGWISCMPLKYTCRKIDDTEMLDNYWAKCGLMRSNTGFAVTGTSCYNGVCCGPGQNIVASGGNYQPGVGTAVYDAGAIGARFVHPVEYVSGLGTTTRGQAYYHYLCTCIGKTCHECITGGVPGLDQANSNYPFGRACDASGAGYLCRCCVPVPYGGSELVNPGIALTHMYPFKGCQTPDGNMAQTKILGWIPGTLDNPCSWWNCCAMWGGIRIITERHTGCNMENAVQMMVNPCMCCGQVPFSGCGCSNGCCCPGGSHFWTQFCNSSRRSYNDNGCCTGETYDFMDWYSLTCGNFFCNCCVCCSPETHRSVCQDHGYLCWREDYLHKDWNCTLNVGCSYECWANMPLGFNCGSEITAPFFKWWCKAWMLFSPRICICCNKFDCGRLSTKSNCCKSNMCCCCGSCRFYESYSFGQRSMWCGMIGYQASCASVNCNISTYAYCNCTGSPWNGTICQQDHWNTRLVHGGGQNGKSYNMSPYGVRSAASHGITVMGNACAHCQHYWWSWLGAIDCYWAESCPSNQYKMNYWYTNFAAVEHIDDSGTTNGMAYIHDTNAAYGTLSSCTATYCVGYQEYAMKYMAYNPEKDCHYFMVRNSDSKNCGIWSINWRFYKWLKVRKYCCCCHGSTIVCFCKSKLKKGLDGFDNTFVGMASRTGCDVSCHLYLCNADTSNYYKSSGNSTGDGPGILNPTGGGAWPSSALGITSVMMMKVADFPGVMTHRKYSTPRMCVSCLFRSDYSLWSLSLYNCSTCGWDAFMSPDLFSWKAANFHTGNLETDCLVSCFSSDNGCMYTVCDCFMANVECDGVLDYCYEFNNYERTGVVLSYGDRLYVKNHSTTPFSFQVWGYEG